MTARTYACKACGGQVDEQARRCRYCSAPVATVRCATCFHMNVPDAGYCSGCGHELGLEPIGETGPLSCPVCTVPLKTYREPPGVLLDCGDCGGQFVDHALLREMLTQHQHVAVPYATTKSSDAAPHSVASVRLDVRTSYIPCPECKSLMNRKNFGTTSGVIVDVCKKHGTWFDTGELPRVLAFVASGGLARAQQREAEEAAHHRSAGAAPLSAGRISGLGGAEITDRTESLVGIFLDLLR